MNIKNQIKRLFLLIFLSAVCFFGYGQNLKTNMNCLFFYIPDETNYIEFQFLIQGEGLTYGLNKNNAYQSIVELNMELLPADTNAKPVVLNTFFYSDEYKDSLAPKANMYHLARLPVPKNEYLMKIRLSDKNNPSETPIIFEQPIELTADREYVTISSIQQITEMSVAQKKTKYTKHNFDYFPYFSTFYPENINSLVIMTEIYNTDVVLNDVSDFQILCFIAKDNEKMAFSEKYLRKKDAKSADMYVFLQSFNIDSLPSGNYRLFVDVYKKDSLLSSKNLFFQRSNPSIKTNNQTANMNDVSKETFMQYLDYIHIIANQQERDFIATAKKLSHEEIDAFFYDFWEKRNPEDPLGAWYDYYENVLRVNKRYSSGRLKGYKTDRGHYYLKYGAPNDIDEYPFTAEYYPYEVWYYYQLKNQTNVIFIFYNRDLSTKDYELIHSTLDGELSDPRWKLRLRPKESRPVNIEDTE